MNKPSVSPSLNNSNRAVRTLPRMLPQRTSRTRRLGRCAAVALCAIVAGALAAGCGCGGGNATDLFGSCNTLGGAARANDFSARSTSVSSLLRTDLYPSLPGGLLGPPLELPDGRLAIISRGDTNARLAVVWRDSVIWNYPFATEEYPMPGIAADSAGTIYTVSTRGLLRAISATGKSTWSVAIESDSAGPAALPSPVLALRGGIVVGNAHGTLTCYNTDGHRRWQIRRGGSVNGPSAASPTLGIVTAVTHNSFDMVDTLIAIDGAGGRQRWATPVGARIVAGPAIIGDAIVVGIAHAEPDGRRAPELAAFGADGRQLWHAPLVLMPRGIAGDHEGNCYVGCSGIGTGAAGGAVVSFTAAGQPRWQATFQSAVAAAPAIGADWIYFIARREGRTGLYCYNRDGTFGSFVSIDIVPDVLSQATISSMGELLLAGSDVPAVLRGE